MKGDSDKKTVIVTGGASGIGRAACELLAREDYKVVIADRDEALGKSLAAELLAADGDAIFVRTDVADAASVQSMVDMAVSSGGHLYGAINCAGVPQRGVPVHELTPEEWDRACGINLRGMFLCVKYQLAEMVRHGSGAIVCVSSIAALKGLKHSVEYCASKAGIDGLVRAAAVDYAAAGIRINALLPGATDTPLARKSQQDNPALAGTLTVPMNRMASPHEVAESAVWLLSEKAAYMTGASIVVDGGMSIC